MHKFNIALGSQALAHNIDGRQNVAVGPNALADNTYGEGNTAVGWFALPVNTSSGMRNTAVGRQALLFISGSYNTALGYGALIP